MTTIPVTPDKPPVLEAIPVTPAVAKSIARPDAFDKAGTMGKGTTGKPANKGVRFRALKATRGPGRPRKTPRDVRNVKYF